MENLSIEAHPWLILIYFTGLWFFITAILGTLSRWYALMRAFPDRDEKALIRLKGQSGTMGGVTMGGIISIAVCRSGLRFGMLRIFGPFCRNFFVPWDQLRVERNAGMLGKTATLQFGEPRVGWLCIPSHVADSLARSVQGIWPEVGSFPKESRFDIFASVFREWLIGTSLASLFFILAPRLAFPDLKNYPPIALAILFPAIVFAIQAVVRYYGRLKRAA